MFGYCYELQDFGHLLPFRMSHIDFKCLEVIPIFYSDLLEYNQIWLQEGRLAFHILRVILCLYCYLEVVSYHLVKPVLRKDYFKWELLLWVGLMLSFLIIQWKFYCFQSTKHAENSPFSSQLVRFFSELDQKLYTTKKLSSES